MESLTITAKVEGPSVSTSVRGWHIVAGMLTAFAIESQNREQAKHNLSLVNQILTRAGRMYRDSHITPDDADDIDIRFAQEDFPQLADAILALVSVNPGCHARVIMGPKVINPNVGGWQAVAWLRRVTEDYQDAFKHAGT